MRCGKSSLLRWLARVTPRPLPASNISAAALFRVIEAAYPTLLIDELDQTDPDKRIELVGIINSSHCRLDARVIRTVGDQHEPRAFSTWAPMALAAIGKLPPQWVDRSIAIEMTRKLTGDRAEGMRLDRDQGFETLRRKAARWAKDHLEAIRSADPAMPLGLNDRQADNWRLLLALADAAGGDWPARARDAAIALSKADDDAESRGIQALADIQQAFAARGDPETMSSDAIVAALVEMEGRPWAEFRRDGKPLTKNALARVLKPFGIVPNTIRQGDATPRGYARSAFIPLWARYLGNQSATPPHPKESAAHSDFQTATPDPDVSVENRPEAKQSAACGGVADGIPGNREERVCCHCGEPILPTDRVIERDDGELIHPACFREALTTGRGW
jgi:putative DNA primase/helicase